MKHFLASILVVTVAAHAMDPDNNNIPEKTPTPAQMLDTTLGSYFYLIQNNPVPAADHPAFKQHWNSLKRVPLYHCLSCASSNPQDECFRALINERYILATSMYKYCKDNNFVTPTEVLDFMTHYEIAQSMAALKNNKNNGDVGN